MGRPGQKCPSDELSEKRERKSSSTTSSSSSKRPKVKFAFELEFALELDFIVPPSIGRYASDLPCERDSDKCHSGGFWAMGGPFHSYWP